MSSHTLEQELIFIVLLLLCSAFFSGSEAAFFSLSKIQRKKMEKSPHKSERRVYKLLENPRQLLVTVLFGNTLLNLAVSSLTALLVLRMPDFLPESVRLLLQVVVMTVVILVFAEITPKVIAYSHANRFAAFASGIMQLLEWILWPIVKVLEGISCLFSRRDITSQQQNTITSEDLRNLIDSKSAENSLEESEQRIIKSIFRLRSTEVREIMIPRVDMVAVDINTDEDALRRRIVESGHSRIPVYKKTIDNIIGFVYAKDLILKGEIHSVGAVMRRPIFVTENMNIQNLLNHFRSGKIHLAIVVDEYGGTSGLITLEDILEEMFGEILDEHDNEKPRIIRVAEDELIVSGMVSVTELNQEFHLGIDDETYENIASFLFDEFNHVPKRNESVRFENRVLFTVTQIRANRIEYVRIKMLEPEESD